MFLSVCWPLPFFSFLVLPNGDGGDDEVREEMKDSLVNVIDDDRRGECTSTVRK